MDGDRDAVAMLREFNRFHTRLVGALDETLLASEYPLPVVRVLFEIGTAPDREPPAAGEIGARLGMDAGYLSRILSRLEGDGMVARTPAAGGGRRLDLSLTEAGRATFAGLDAASAAEVGALIAPLSAGERGELVAALARARALLSGEEPGPVTLRAPEAGELGWIVHRHGALYAAEYGWGAAFEGLVAGIVGDFVTDFREGEERVWVADRGGRVVGSVFVVRDGPGVAKLRLLYVEPEVRGTGTGRALLSAAMDFARDAGYGRMVLWTNDVLVEARRLYERAGFALVSEAAHRDFGVECVGQVWGVDL